MEQIVYILRQALRAELHDVFKRKVMEYKVNCDKMFCNAWTCTWLNIEIITNWCLLADASSTTGIL